MEKLVKQTERLQLADNMVRARQLCEEMARCAREVRKLALGYNKISSSH